MRVDILSERKGSNPGGVCQAHDNGFSIRGYFKYCHGSRIAGKSSFVPQHQPIYEAMTFEMARRLGLDTVDYFVLLNEGSRVSRRSRDIQFSGWKDYNFSHNPSGRLFYFMSKMESAPEDEFGASANSVLDCEKIFLDSILIADVVGKRQNYLVFGNNSGQRVEYLDLGCSFVHATDGFLHQKNQRPKIVGKKRMRNARGKLNGKSIVANDGRTVKLADLADSPRNMSVQCLNPHRSFPVADLISPNEIDEIQEYLIQGLVSSLPIFKKEGILR
ncbi:hypothetical protein CMI47_13685 [Candidatus Pacearchaeota archaeon]|nr:hypothetical protein [Candidatus Pacearchaeota archaeon]|tara:strand:- start:529 stop:1350 length:822 start_codon:yes stop_codon:yes gene_type:complete